MKRNVHYVIFILAILARSTFSSQHDIISEHDLLHLAQKESSTKKVAIIGSGSAGSSTAHYLHKLFNENISSKTRLEIEIYEKNNDVGGRNKHFTLEDGTNIEIGGSVYHIQNYNIRNFTLNNNFTERLLAEEGLLGIWNGNEFVFLESDYSFITAAKILWRYGWGPVTTKKAANVVKDMFLNVYNLLSSKIHLESDHASADRQSVPYLKTFANPDEMFEELGILNYTRVSLENFLLEKGVSQLFLDEIATVVTRINYGQFPSVSAMSGSISFVGSGTSVVSVKEGISTVWKKVIENSGAKVHLSTSVERISYEKQSESDVHGKYRIDARKLTSHNDGDENNASSDLYDAVVIATPLELAHIDIDKKSITLPSNLNVNRKWQKTFVTLIVGKLNNAYFGFSEQQELPSLIGATKNSSIPWRSIAIKAIANASGKPINVYKIFSDVPMAEEQLSQLFSERLQTLHHEWNAYPVLTPLPNDFVSPPFQLHDKLFYVNGLETIFSVIELESLGGQNVAQMLHNEWAL